MSVAFAHLHLHTQYSLLDGACLLDDLLDEVKRLKMDYVSITDHGNLFGVVPFCQKAMAKGINPIVGMEAYIARKGRKNFGNSNEKDYGHLILLVKNEQGYKNLLKLSTISYMEGFYRKPRMDRELLSIYHEGLIALSACLGGEIPILILEEKINDAMNLAKEYEEIFGSGNFYLEIQDHGIPEQKKVISGITQIAKETGMPLVATNDVHFLRKEDFGAHTTLIRIQTGQINTDKVSLSYTKNHYLKSPEEMEFLFSQTPEALSATMEIARKCSFIMEKQPLSYPDFPTEGEEVKTLFKRKVNEGFEKRLNSFKQSGLPIESYKARLELEKKVIRDKGFESYFLIVWDLVDFAKKNGIPVGPGRGSAVGSLVAYCLGITDLDPLRYNLLFERFLNPERKSLPDIDIDLCQRRREEVIEHVRNKYGSENVAQIITFSELHAKAVIRDVARTMGIDLKLVDKICKMIPDGATTVKRARETIKELATLSKEREDVSRLFDIASRLEGLTRHASTHAAGIVIAPKPITNYCPLFKMAEDKSRLSTQYAKDEMEFLGLLKMDLLGLQTLTVLDDSMKLIKENTGNDIDLSTIPLDDPEIYKLFREGRTDGIFQFESSGMKDILRRLEPDHFEDLIVLNALYRPGPIQSGMIDDFILRRKGKKEITYLVPELESILKETYGVVVYQEQVMLIAHDLAGFTLGQADVLRKAMGKKQDDVMRAQMDVFVKGAVSHRIDKGKAEELFELLAKFAEYGFNKSHSAAYALVAYQTAYLKSHYPLQFMTALLSADMNKAEKLVKAIRQAEDMGIKILPPDVQKSRWDFSVEGGAIRYGIGAVKNIGSSAVNAIFITRDRIGKFKDFYHFCESVGPKGANKKVLEYLIKSGAMDSFGKRWDLIASVEKGRLSASSKENDRLSGQGALFIDDGTSKVLLEKGQEWTEREQFRYEKEALGFYYSGHPYEVLESRIGPLTTHSLKGLKKIDGSAAVIAGGLATSFKVKKSKNKGTHYGILVIEDIDESVEVLLFKDVLEKGKPKITLDHPIIVKGQAQVEANGVKILSDEILTIEEAEDTLPLQAKALIIKIGSLQIDEDLLIDLTTILNDYNGKVPVVAEIQEGEDYMVRLALRSIRGVAPTKDFCRKVETLLGKGHLTFSYKNGNLKYGSANQF